MEKFISAAFSLLDYDGDLLGFSREGTGKQDWPGFCTVNGKWQQNKLNGSSRLEFKNFPLVVNGNFKDNVVQDASINFGEGIFRLDVKLAKDLKIESGIIGFYDNYELHFKITAEAPHIVLMQSGSILDTDSYVENNLLRYPLNPQKSTYVSFDSTSLVLELYNVDEAGRRFNACHQIDIANNQYAVLNYDMNRLSGEQITLNLNKPLPYTSRYYVDSADDEEDVINFADGSTLTNKSGENVAKLVYRNADSYITGKKVADALRGPVSVIVDGKYSMSAEMTDKGLLFEDPSKLFRTIDSAIEQTLDEYDDKLLNGHTRYDYGNDMYYEGYFLNDFIYCHKDSLLSCLHSAKSPSCADLEAFMTKIARFQGTVQDGKILGKAKVKYKNGNLYEGAYDEYFLKSGSAMQFASNGDLYSGEFKHDMFNGFGKLFRADQPLVLGIFEDNVLKVTMDIDNLDKNIIERAKEDYQKALTQNEQKLQEVIAQKNFKQSSEEERAKLDRDAKLQQLVEEEKARKAQEADRIIEELQREIIVKKIFSFKNGYAYHGKIKGNTILDNETGDIIDREGNRIPVSYKFVKDLNIGSFRSLNKKLVFVYKPDTKELAKIELNRAAEEAHLSGIASKKHTSVLVSDASANNELSSILTQYNESNKTKAQISETEGISILVVPETTEQKLVQSDVYMEVEAHENGDKNNEQYKKANLVGENNNDPNSKAKSDNNAFFTIVEDSVENESGIDYSNLRNSHYQRIANDARPSQSNLRDSNFK